jgi:hypothetical protein
MCSSPVHRSREPLLGGPLLVFLRNRAELPEIGVPVVAVAFFDELEALVQSLSVCFFFDKATVVHHDRL